MCFRSLKSTLISPHSTQITRLICRCRSGCPKPKMTGMWYLDEIIADFRSVKHLMLTNMIIYAAVQRIITQFDDGDHEIHHSHDFASERPIRVKGGDMGEDAINSLRSGRFERYKGFH